MRADIHPEFSFSAGRPAASHRRAALRTGYCLWARPQVRMWKMPHARLPARPPFTQFRKPVFIRVR